LLIINPHGLAGRRGSTCAEGGVHPSGVNPVRRIPAEITTREGSMKAMNMISEGVKEKLTVEGRNGAKGSGWI